MDVQIVEGALMIVTGVATGVSGKAIVDWLRTGRNGNAPARKEDIDVLHKGVEDIKVKIDNLPCPRNGERIAALEERTKTL